MIAEQYNMNMAGVDRIDQMLGSCQFPHNASSGATLFHRTRKIALVNGYIIYCKASERNKLDFWKTGNPSQVKQGCPSNTPVPQRFTGQPFPGKYEDKKCKADCEVCSDRKSGNWHRTSYYCKQCYMPLCVVPCFELYHAVMEY